jgi:hypothetical protein
MRSHPLIFLYAACAFVLFASACKHSSNKKLIGEWHSTKDGSKLKITDKAFTIESDSPDPEDYFVKGDTIYTSFEGNLPYTKYAILKLDEHQLKLFTPDSTTIAYTK